MIFVSCTPAAARGFPGGQVVRMGGKKQTGLGAFWPGAPPPPAPVGALPRPKKKAKTKQATREPAARTDPEAAEVSSDEHRAPPEADSGSDLVPARQPSPQACSPDSPGRASDSSPLGSIGGWEAAVRTAIAARVGAVAPDGGAAMHRSPSSGAETLVLGSAMPRSPSSGAEALSVGPASAAALEAPRGPPSAAPVGPPSAALVTQGWAGKALVPPTEQPSCKYCRAFLDPFAKGVRLLSKSAQVFCCPGCNSKTTILAKVFGHWPIDEFKQLASEEQTAFFQTSGTGRDNLKKAVHEQVMKKWAHQKTNKVEGDFMPDWWWRSKGMPEETIEKMKAAGAVEEHPIMGNTFQVMIHGTSESATEELARQQLLSATTRKGKGAAAADSAAAGSGRPIGETAAAEETAAAATPAREEETSSSASDSDSSSSSSKKRKGNQKKKKDKNK